MSEDYEDRLRGLEKENYALRSEIQLLRQELHQLQGKISTLNTILGRFLWIIGGGFIASIVTWVVGGGLVR